MNRQNNPGHDIKSPIDTKMHILNKRKLYININIFYQANYQAKFSSTVKNTICTAKFIKSIACLLIQLLRSEYCIPPKFTCQNLISKMILRDTIPSGVYPVVGIDQYFFQIVSQEF